MAPNSRPPGNRVRATTTAMAVETVTRIASSASDAPGAVTRATGPTVDPNSASPAGSPSTISSTRMVCTIAIPRRSAPSSAASASTCAIEPGLAPSTADSGSHPCTKRR